MIQEILKSNGLEDNQIQTIMNSMKEAKVYTTKLENVDERYSKLKTQKTELETQLKERDTQLADLSKNNKDNEQLLTQIKDLQALNKQTATEYEGKISKLQFDFALDSALSGAKCKNSKALKALLDIDNVKLNEGKLEGLEEQINNLKESDSYLFDLDTPPGNTGGLGNFGRGTNPTTATTKDQFKQMNMAQRIKLRNDNPSLYEELSQ